MASIAERRHGLPPMASQGEDDGAEKVGIYG